MSVVVSVLGGALLESINRRGAREAGVKEEEEEEEGSREGVLSLSPPSAPAESRLFYFTLSGEPKGTWEKRVFGWLFATCMLQ